MVITSHVVRNANKFSQPTSPQNVHPSHCWPRFTNTIYFKSFGRFSELWTPTTPNARVPKFVLAMIFSFNRSMTYCSVSNICITLHLPIYGFTCVNSLFTCHPSNSQVPDNPLRGMSVSCFPLILLISTFTYSICQTPWNKVTHTFLKIF